MKNKKKELENSIHKRRVGDVTSQLMTLARNLVHTLKHAETVMN
jgi:hypothetical protein